LGAELSFESERACREKLEEALVEYVERYGLTESARLALIQCDKLRDRTSSPRPHGLHKDGGE
jgi:hypothetical protein